MGGNNRLMGAEPSSTVLQVGVRPGSCSGSGSGSRPRSGHRALTEDEDGYGNWPKATSDNIDNPSETKEMRCEKKKGWLYRMVYVSLRLYVCGRECLATGNLNVATFSSLWRSRTALDPTLVPP